MARAWLKRALEGDVAATTRSPHDAGAVGAAQDASSRARSISRPTRGAPGSQQRARTTRRCCAKRKRCSRARDRRRLPRAAGAASIRPISRRCSRGTHARRRIEIDRRDRPRRHGRRLPGRDMRLGRRVALKALPAALAMRPGAPRAPAPRGARGRDDLASGGRDRLRARGDRRSPVHRLRVRARRDAARARSSRGADRPERARARSPPRSPARWPRRTTPASSIATSSPRTC